jgi:hypothetical protein
MAKTFSVSGLATGATFTAAGASGDDWLSVSQDGSTVTVAAGAYTDTTADRNSTVTVTASDGATATLAVTQYRKSAIVLSPEALSFDAAGN